LELLKQYEAYYDPTKARSKNGLTVTPPLDLSDALARAEHEMLDNPPAGKRKGLLEFNPPELRGLGDVHNVYRAPRFADVLEVIPETQWPEKIAEPDAARLRPFIWDILDQDGVGSCASESCTGTVMCRRSVRGAPQIKLSPWFVYGRVNGGYDGGSTLSANLEFLMSKGVASQDVWPRSKGWRTSPSEEAYENALRHRILKVVRITDKASFGSALLYGLPVYFGYDSHAIYGCDPIDRTRFRYANSWDESWGDGGFGTLSYSSIVWSFASWAILSVTTPEDEV